ncbi:hypothetical protein [Bacillus sp. JJ722]|uniref:hypothetical protein n=1 Tax=Bacillus sp. JJ722 TaxID=3122973 RepID=UPI002FFF0DF2
MAYLNKDGDVYTSARQDADSKPITDVHVKGASKFTGNVAKVTTSGARVKLPANPCREVTIIALKGNTGSIYVGGANVSSTVFGVELLENESITIAVNNTDLIYIDASVNGEGVSYVAV